MAGTTNQTKLPTALDGERLLSIVVIFPRRLRRWLVEFRSRLRFHSITGERINEQIITTQQSAGEIYKFARSMFGSCSHFSINCSQWSEGEGNHIKLSPPLGYRN